MRQALLDLVPCDVVALGHGKVGGCRAGKELANVGLIGPGRERAEAPARQGPDSGQQPLVADLDRTILALEDGLAHERDDRLLRVLDSLTIRLDEYLKTRLVEPAVHIDDLAVSVGVATPQMPSGAIEVSIDTLLEVARRSHGDLAILRALGRRERDTVNALRVL